MLTLDPEPVRGYPEPPYDPRRAQLYAPVAPFAAAINEWLGRYQARTGATQFAGITLRNGQKSVMADRGITELANRAGIPARTIRRYITDQQWINLQNADKLAIALGIPLCLLADDFRPRRDTMMRDRRNRVA
jgi:transcriptional regulator with XRE-family HTH domain